MGFKDLHTIREMFAELDGYAQLEDKHFEVHQYRMRQQRLRRASLGEPEREPFDRLAYQREWQKRRRSTPEGAAAKKLANATWYQRAKSDPDKYRKLLAKIRDRKAAKRRERKLQKEAV